jgi:hypothetical protein
VSGGSATAAYYALVGDQILEDFERRFLSQDLQSDLVGRILSPTNWPRLTSSSFGRSDLVAEVLDDHMLGKATFIDLVQRGRRPFVTINATDMATGHRFEFIQEQFDLMCSDMNTVRCRVLLLHRRLYRSPSMTCPLPPHQSIGRSPRG